MACDKERNARQLGSGRDACLGQVYAHLISGKCKDCECAFIDELAFRFAEYQFRMYVGERVVIPAWVPDEMRLDIDEAIDFFFGCLVEEQKRAS